jgi:small conductance mechanosensitive channel
MFWIDVSKYLDLIIELSISYIPKVIGALFVLYIWFKIVKYIEKIIERLLEKQKISPMLQSFILSLSNILLKILVVISSAWILGVQTNSFVAMLAAAWFAIGMALSGTLQNFAWWIMILLLKPFKIWDYVEAWGHAWTIKKINIFNTLLVTPDKKRIIIPNSDISNGALTNYSSEPKRRIDFVIWVSYDDDIDKVKKTLLEIAEKDERVLQDDWITIWLLELWDNSVNFAFRFYVKTSNYWPTKFDILETVKKTFDKKKISFPFPQRDVHMYNEK